MKTDGTEPVHCPSARAESANERLPGLLEVNVESGDDVERALEEAIAVITQIARHYRVGILITRTGAFTYVVRAHPVVPFGLIRQHRGQGA